MFNKLKTDPQRIIKSQPCRVNLKNKIKCKKEESDPNRPQSPCGVKSCFLNQFYVELIRFIILVIFPVTLKNCEGEIR